MSTIKSFFVLSAVLFSTMLFGQASVNNEIQATLDGFIEQSNNKDWNKAFDYMYPKMFDQVSKQDLVDMMKSTEEDGMSIKVSDVRITSTSAPFEDSNGETFVRIGDSTRNDMIKIRKIRINIESKAMHGHPSAQMDANSAYFPSFI